MIPTQWNKPTYRGKSISQELTKRQFGTVFVDQDFPVEHFTPPANMEKFRTFLKRIAAIIKNGVNTNVGPIKKGEGILIHVKQGDKIPDFCIRIDAYKTTVINEISKIYNRKNRHTWNQQPFDIKTEHWGIAPGMETANCPHCGISRSRVKDSTMYFIGPVQNGVMKENDIFEIENTGCIPKYLQYPVSLNRDIKLYIELTMIDRRDKFTIYKP